MNDSLISSIFVQLGDPDLPGRPGDAHALVERQQEQLDRVPVVHADLRPDTSEMSNFLSAVPAYERFVHKLHFCTALYLGKRHGLMSAIFAIVHILQSFISCRLRTGFNRAWFLSNRSYPPIVHKLSFAHGFQPHMVPDGCASRRVASLRARQPAVPKEPRGASGPIF